MAASGHRPVHIKGSVVGDGSKEMMSHKQEYDGSVVDAFSATAKMGPGVHVGMTVGGGARDCSMPALPPYLSATIATMVSGEEQYEVGKKGRGDEGSLP